jgi:hypothetical protein
MQGTNAAQPQCEQQFLTTPNKPGAGCSRNVEGATHAGCDEVP